jgi:hypothetical protein
MNRFTEVTAKRSSGAQWTALVVVAALLVAMSSAYAATSRSACTLPVPDGGDVAPSKANAEGRIVRVGSGFIEVARRSGRLIHVSYSDKTEFYTAFGGDYDPSELATGRHVAVWFVGCKTPSARGGQAAYLQLYSRDTADQPPV